MDIISPSITRKTINDAFITPQISGGQIANGVVGTITSSPTALVVGSNTITCTHIGDLAVTLPVGTVATVISGNVALVTGSPLSLVAGTTTITITG
jgi:hypothetical protein